MQRLFRFIWIVTILVAALPGCSSEGSEDFWIVVDARLAPHLQEVPTEHIYLEISADGSGSYLLYDTGGAIVYDTDGMVSISPEQILERGEINLTQEKISRLAQSIQDSDFFNLTEDYRMSIGGAYTFLAVTAGGQTHMVDNIGMQVDPLEKIIDTLNRVLPVNLEMEYYLEGIWDW
jgi:hypothetical protein